jgi:hypothetical protein
MPELQELSEDSLAEMLERMGLMQPLAERELVGMRAAAAAAAAGAEGSGESSVNGRDLTGSRWLPPEVDEVYLDPSALPRELLEELIDEDEDGEWVGLRVALARSMAESGAGGREQQQQEEEEEEEEVQEQEGLGSNNSEHEVGGSDGEEAELEWIGGVQELQEEAGAANESRPHRRRVLPSLFTGPTLSRLQGIQEDSPPQLSSPLSLSAAASMAAVAAAAGATNRLVESGEWLAAYEFGREHVRRQQAAQQRAQAQQYSELMRMLGWPTSGATAASAARADESDPASGVQGSSHVSEEVQDEQQQQPEEDEGVFAGRHEGLGVEVEGEEHGFLNLLLSSPEMSPVAAWRPERPESIQETWVEGSPNGQGRHHGPAELQPGTTETNVTQLEQLNEIPEIESDEGGVGTQLPEAEGQAASLVVGLQEPQGIGQAAATMSGGEEGVLESILAGQQEEVVSITTDGVASGAVQEASAGPVAGAGTVAAQLSWQSGDEQVEMAAEQLAEVEGGRVQDAAPELQAQEVLAISLEAIDAAAEGARPRSWPQLSPTAAAVTDVRQGAVYSGLASAPALPVQNGAGFIDVRGSRANGARAQVHGANNSSSGGSNRNMVFGPITLTNILPGSISSSNSSNNVICESNNQAAVRGIEGAVVASSNTGGSSGISNQAPPLLAAASAAADWSGTSWDFRDIDRSRSSWLAAAGGRGAQQGIGSGRGGQGILLSPEQQQRVGVAMEEDETPLDESGVEQDEQQPQQQPVAMVEDGSVSVEATQRQQWQQQGQGQHRHAGWFDSMMPGLPPSNAAVGADNSDELPELLPLPLEAVFGPERLGVASTVAAADPGERRASALGRGLSAMLQSMYDGAQINGRGVGAGIGASGGGGPGEQARDGGRWGQGRPFVFNGNGHPLMAIADVMGWTAPYVAPLGVAGVASTAAAAGVVAAGGEGGAGLHHTSATAADGGGGGGGAVRHLGLPPPPPLQPLATAAAALDGGGSGSLRGNDGGIGALPELRVRTSFSRRIRERILAGVQASGLAEDSSEDPMGQVLQALEADNRAAMAALAATRQRIGERWPLLREAEQEGLGHGEANLGQLPQDEREGALDGGGLWGSNAGLHRGSRQALGSAQVDDGEGGQRVGAYAAAAAAALAGIMPPAGLGESLGRRFGLEAELGFNAAFEQGGRDGEGIGLISAWGSENGLEGTSHASTSAQGSSSTSTGALQAGNAAAGAGGASGIRTRLPFGTVAGGSSLLPPHSPAAGGIGMGGIAGWQAPYARLSARLRAPRRGGGSSTTSSNTGEGSSPGSGGGDGDSPGFGSNSSSSVERAMQNIVEGMRLRPARSPMVAAQLEEPGDLLRMLFEMSDGDDFGFLHSSGSPLRPPAFLGRGSSPGVGGGFGGLGFSYEELVQLEPVRVSVPEDVLRGLQRRGYTRSSGTGVAGDTEGRGDGAEEGAAGGVVGRVVEEVGEQAGAAAAAGAEVRGARGSGFEEAEDGR